MQSLRDRLRADTARQHCRVEDAYSGLNLARREDFAAFLRANLSALQAIGCRRGPAQADAESLRREMCAALAADLHHLEGGEAELLGPCQAEPLAVQYILLGSRAGTRLLRRHWQETSDERVAGASAYFGLEPEGRAWRDLRHRLSLMPSQGDEADRTVRDAAAIFELYLEAFGANQPMTGALNG